MTRNNYGVKLHTRPCFFQLSLTSRFRKCDTVDVPRLEYPGEKVLIAHSIEDQLRFVRLRLCLSAIHDEKRISMSLLAADYHYPGILRADAPDGIFAGGQRDVIYRESEWNIGLDCVDNLGAYGRQS